MEPTHIEGVDTSASQNSMAHIPVSRREWDQNMLTKINPDGWKNIPKCLVNAIKSIVEGATNSFFDIKNVVNSNFDKQM